LSGFFPFATSNCSPLPIAYLLEAQLLIAKIDFYHPRAIKTPLKAAFEINTKMPVSFSRLLLQIVVN